MMVARTWLALAGLASALFAACASASPVEHAPRQTDDDAIFSFREIFVPPSDYNIPKTLYGRTVQLDDGTLLATW